MFSYTWCAMLRGNQHGSGPYDDLQNWLDMTSHETLYWGKFAPLSEKGQKPVKSSYHD